MTLVLLSMPRPRVLPCILWGMSGNGRLRLSFIGSQFSSLRCAIDLAVNRSDKEAASQGYMTEDFQMQLKKKC